MVALPVELLSAAVDDLLPAMLLEEDPPRSELLVEEAVVVLPDTLLVAEELVVTCDPCVEAVPVVVEWEFAADPDEVVVAAWEFVVAPPDIAAEPVAELVMALVEVAALAAFSVPVVDEAAVFTAVLDVSEAATFVEDPTAAEPVPVAAAAAVSPVAPFVEDVEGAFDVAPPLVVSDTAAAALGGAFEAAGVEEAAVPDPVVAATGVAVTAESAAVELCGLGVAATAVLAEGVTELLDPEVTAGALEASAVDGPELIAELVEVPPVVVLVPAVLDVDVALVPAAVDVELPVVAEVPAITVEPLDTAPLQLSRTMTEFP